MKQTNPLLLIDFYKAVHDLMLPNKMTKSVSYGTPRMSRVNRWKEIVQFGLQPLVKTYFIDYFNNEFFNKPLEEVIAEYERVLNATLGEKAYSSEKIKKLHQLGYLPIEITALKEGTLVPVHIPMFEISNTHPDFAWLPQALESLLSAEIWHPMLSATVGYTYRQIVNKYYDISVENNVPRSRALGDFSFRGQECLQSAVKSSAGWCLSFLNTATVPVIPFLEQMYNCNCTKEPVAFGSPSSEHSVMCSNFAVDGDEITFYKRILTQIYPDVSFSVVCDSYDYVNVVENILPQLKEEIMQHNGCMLIRGDSGNCVKVVTETVFKLWDIFGGTINSKGFKVLDPHVKAIYGDSITVQRCEEIYKILIENGFACNNVALGVGSFSMQCIEEEDTIRVKLADGSYVEGTAIILKPFTRDTFSFCVKATYCEIDGKPYPIFKNPKDGGFKKSQRGCCIVWEENGKLFYNDGCTWDQAHNSEVNLLQPIFKDGKMVKEDTLKEVRDRLHGGNF